MKELKIEVIVEELQLEELAADEQELVKKACDATACSYAKYSNFNVGAAVRLADGSVVTGANQENAAFPLCLCAERTAIFAAQAHHPELAITHIAISARTANGFTPSPISPCGSCRQVMVEMEDRYKNNMVVLLYGAEKIYRVHSAKHLLPLGFVDEDMNV